MKKSINTLHSAILLLLSLIALSGCFSSSPVADSPQYAAPDWVPAYEQGVRYYYIPDIETYYDASNRNFVYFDHGQWIYSNDLPPVYSGYDLFNGYAVALDRRVYEPWRYHQNYISSYPPHYYKNIYPDRNNETVRGYNETARHPIYSSSDRSRRSNANSNSSRMNDRRNNTPPPAQPAQPSQTTKPAPVNQPEPFSSASSSKNRRVGKPVKVTPDMRQPQKTSPTNSPGSRRGDINPATSKPDNARKDQPQSGTSPENTQSKPEKTKPQEDIKPETKAWDKENPGRRR